MTELPGSKFAESQNRAILEMLHHMADLQEVNLNVECHFSFNITCNMIYLC